MSNQLDYENKTFSRSNASSISWKQKLVQTFYSNLIIDNPIQSNLILIIDSDINIDVGFVTTEFFDALIDNFSAILLFSDVLYHLSS